MKRTVMATFAFVLANTLVACGGGDGPMNVPQAPSAPTNVQVTQAGNGELSLSWSGVAGATSYTVYMASQAGVSKTNYSGLPDGQRLQSATSPTLVTGLEARAYYFVVTASNMEGESAESAQASATPNIPPPAAPTNVQVAQAGNGELSVSWTDVAGATSHTVYLASQAGVLKTNYSGLPDGQRIQSATSPTLVTSLEARAYYFVVTASNLGGESAEAAEASATPNVPLNPQANTQLAGGTHTFTSMNVPAGVTLTVTGPAVINVIGDATLDGTLTGDCQMMELRVTGDLTLDGLLSNSCTAPPAGMGPSLKVVADGELVIGTVASNEDAIVSDGDIRITDSATENESFDPVFDTETGPPSAGPAAAASAQQALAGGAAVRKPIRARRGGSIRQSDDGNILIGGDITAEDGMDAPAKTEQPICDNTNAFGGNGGSVGLASRGGTLTIGDGVTLKAGDGGRGGDCTADADGADAVASAGTGGRGGSVMVGGQTVTFGTNVILMRGNGGPGGDANAFGGDGQNPCEDGYAAMATGGLGGKAGGVGYVILSPGQINGAPTEEGANGGMGGTGTAIGGDGAACACLVSDGIGGDGGMGTATGGTGGDGAKGNIWTPNSHKGGFGGNADGFGGVGGEGADCCAEKLPGGNGGMGGDGAATGGPMGAAGVGGNGKMGAADGFGGKGGDGGDGLGPGNGGEGGKATGAGDPAGELDGADGEDGELCADLKIWYIYFSSIPDGDIEPGSDVPLNVFDYDQTTQTGTVTAHFQTPEEAQKETVQYFKSGEFLFVGPGGVMFPLTSLTGFPTVIVQSLLDLLCPEANCVELVGYYQGEEVARMGSYAWTPGPTNDPHCLNSSPTSYCRQVLELPPPPQGVPYYDAFALVATGQFWMYHWGLIIIDP